MGQLGYDVRGYSSPEDALEGIEAHLQAVGLVLSDQVMPTMDGLTLAQTLRERGYDIPIVIMSGYSPDLSTTSAQAVGVDAILWKPFNTRELKALLDQLLPE